MSYVSRSALVLSNKKSAALDLDYPEVKNKNRWATCPFKDGRNNWKHFLTIPFHKFAFAHDQKYRPLAYAFFNGYTDYWSLHWSLFFSILFFHLKLFQKTKLTNPLSSGISFGQKVECLLKWAWIAALLKGPGKISNFKITRLWQLKD